MRSRAWGNVAWLMVLGLLLAVCAMGCDDGSQAMYKQISNSNGGKTPLAGRPDAGGDPAAQPGATAATTGANGATAAAPGTEGQPAEGEVAEGEYTGPKIKVEIKEVKAPYPQFEAKGYYDVSITAQAEEHLDFAVWDIIFQDKDGNEVARQIQAIKISYAEPMDLRFTDVYCKAKPLALEFRKTDKQAKKPEAGDGEDGTGRSGGKGGGPVGGGVGAE